MGTIKEVHLLLQASSEFGVYDFCKIQIILFVYSHSIVAGGLELMS